MAVLTTSPRPAKPAALLRSDRIGDLMTSWVDRLPSGMARFLPRDMVGYAVLGLVTFVLALLFLLLLHRTTPLPLGAAVVLADATAWALNFWLNRKLNFRSVARIGPQAARYGLVICGDLAISAVVTTGLAGFGVPLSIARVIAGGCITFVGYLTCRWWVFRDQCRPA
jgi:putative flippase GtrA